MVTFCLVLLVFGVLLAIAVCGIMAVGVIAGGALLIVLDVCIGILPFVGLFMLIRWLFKKRERG